MLLNQENDILTVDDLCEVLRIGKNAAYKLINSGKLKCYRINRIWKITRQSVEEYIDEARKNYFITWYNPLEPIALGGYIGYVISVIYLIIYHIAITYKVYFLW